MFWGVVTDVTDVSACVPLLRPYNAAPRRLLVVYSLCGGQNSARIDLLVLQSTLARPSRKNGQCVAHITSGPAFSAFGWP